MSLTTGKSYRRVRMRRTCQRNGQTLLAGHVYGVTAAEADELALSLLAVVLHDH